MQKIVSLFQRVGNERNVSNIVDSKCQWVIDGEGQPTRKYDGTACLYRGGVFYKRLKWDEQNGAPPPMWLHWDFNPEQKSGHGWYPVGEGPEDIFHREAITRYVDSFGNPFEDNLTYELCGPRVQKNAEGFPRHTLVPHGRVIVPDFPREYEAIRRWFLRCGGIEGVVWHHPDGRFAKVKCRDFGIPRNTTMSEKRRISIQLFNQTYEELEQACNGAQLPAIKSIM